MATQVDGRSVLNSALEPGEPCFILRVNDELAQATVEYWIRLAMQGGVGEQVIQSAQAIRKAMWHWHDTHGTKVPD